MGGRQAPRPRLPQGARRARGLAVRAGARSRGDPDQPDLGRRAADSAGKSLHENVSRLRKSLRAAGGTGQELSQRSGSYVLEVNRQDVDVWRFRMLRDQARARGPRRRRARLRPVRRGGSRCGAASRWTGSTATGRKGSGPRLTRNGSPRRCNASGRPAARHGTPTWSARSPDLVRQHPLDEELLDLYLRALYGSGRKAEALSAYHEAERRWREGYGGDLGPALRDLHQLMLHDDPTLSASPRRPASGPPAAAATAATPASSSTMPAR